MLLPGERVVLLREGLLDSAAQLAFLDGHCHSLALALATHTGWPLVAIANRAGAVVHVAVGRPDGRIVDVTGAQLPARLADAAGGGTVRALARCEAELLPRRHGWVEVDARADAWVTAVLARAEQAPQPPMAKPELRLTRETQSAIEVRVSWCGDPELIVDVRWAGTDIGAWRRYGRVALPKDGHTWRFDFEPRNFERLAQRWLQASFDEPRAVRKLTVPPS